MTTHYDAIVIGAGPAGTIFSSELGKAGFDVALVDRKPKDKIGQKVCGDGISRGYFDTLNLKKPSGEELARKVDRGDVYSPNLQGLLTVEGKGYTINRYPFGQRLLRRAEKQGVKVLPKTDFKNPLLKNGAVQGVLVKDIETGEETKMKAQVTMDASGMTAAVRSKLPADFLIETKIDKFDIDIAHRYIAEFPKENWKWRGKSISVYLDQEVIPGGYGWVFPKKGNTINVGTGIQTLGKGVSPKQITDEFLEQTLNINLKDLNIIRSGTGIVPVRRPLSMLVNDGFVLAGDAASHANPLHGGGIGHAMKGAYIAAKVIIPKLEENEVILTKEDMWEYPKKFFEEEGAKNAALEVIRLALQGFNNEELNYIIEKGLISGNQLTLLQSEPSKGMSILKKIGAGIRLTLFHRALKNKLQLVRKLYGKMYKIYQNYPENPSKLKKWHGKGKKVLQKAKEGLWQDPYEWRE